MGPPSPGLLTATDKVWSSDKQLSHLKRLKCAYSFSKSTTEILSGHGAWQSPKTLPTMVRCQAIPTWQRPIEGGSLIRHPGTQCTALWVWAVITVTSTQWSAQKSPNGKSDPYKWNNRLSNLTLRHTLK